MRFKRIFLIFALAMFMLTGIARSDDDNPFPNIDLDACPFLIAIEAPSSTFVTIATFFDGGCAQVYNEIKVETCTLESHCDNADKESPLGVIAASFQATIPTTALVCAICEEDPEEQLNDIIPQIEDAMTTPTSTAYLKRRITYVNGQTADLFPVFEYRPQKNLMPEPTP